MSLALTAGKAGVSYLIALLDPNTSTLVRIDPPLLVGSDPSGDVGSRSELRA
jgi:hypothetical protein